MGKKYKVKLTPNQRTQLLEIVRNGKQQAKTIAHAQILLQADSGEEGTANKVKVIGADLNLDECTVHRVREAFANNGLETALYRKKHRQYSPRKLDGEQEAHWVVLCILPEENAEFVCRMENVLDLYKQPYNPDYRMSPASNTRQGKTGHLCPTAQRSQKSRGSAGISLQAQTRTLV